MEWEEDGAVIPLTRTTSSQPLRNHGEKTQEQDGLEAVTEEEIQVLRGSVEETDLPSGIEATDRLILTRDR